MVDVNNIVRIEYSILGAVLMWPDHVGEVVARLGPEHFSTLGSRGLFEAISALHFAGAPIDPVTVVQKAGTDYEIVVQEAKDSYVVPSNLPYYCDLLLEQGKLRQVQAEAITIAGAETLKEVGETIDRLNGLMVARKSVEILGASQAAMDFYNRQDADRKPEYLTWGMDALNKCLYAELGDFIVVGGYPSAGKTLLSIQFAVEMAAKYRVGYFSL